MTSYTTLARYANHYIDEELAIAFEQAAAAIDACAQAYRTYASADRWVSTDDELDAAYAEYLRADDLRETCIAAADAMYARKTGGGA